MPMSRENRHGYHEIRRRRRRRRRLKQRVAAFAFLTVCTAVLIIAGKLLWSGASFVVSSAYNAYMSLYNTESISSSESVYAAADTGTSSSSETEAIVDETPPVLTGVSDLMVYQGDTVSYLKNVTVSDDIDPEPVVSVDSGDVDLSIPGEYEIVYTATDISGNAATASAKVTVLEKEAGFVDLETIYAAVDAKLEEILRPDVTVEQQVHDIYAYARLDLRYGGSSDHTDYRQTAYAMLTEGRGDCYGYFALTKLFFERLGIPNIDVVKMKNSPDDSDHFWSLVSIDGGETWYHFDATPRVGDGDDFCLVTDSFIDAYSAQHSGSHNRDKSLYPATP